MIAREPSALERRVGATQELLDAWKGRPFDWKAKSHCGRMVADHLRRMGYTPPLAKAGTFASEAGALRALKRLGADTLAQAMDQAGFARIPPAAAIVGDVVELAGEGPLGCLTVALGNGRVCGFVQDEPGVVVLQPTEHRTAWRVEPL